MTFGFGYRCIGVSAESTELMCIHAAVVEASHKSSVEPITWLRLWNEPKNRKPSHRGSFSGKCVKRPHLHVILSVRRVYPRMSTKEIQARINPIVWMRLKLTKIIETKPGGLGFAPKCKVADDGCSGNPWHRCVYCIGQRTRWCWTEHGARQFSTSKQETGPQSLGLVV